MTMGNYEMAPTEKRIRTFGRNCVRGPFLFNTSQGKKKLKEMLKCCSHNMQELDQKIVINKAKAST